MTFAAIALLMAATFTCPFERVMTMDPAVGQSTVEFHAIQLVYETPLQIDYRARPYRLVSGFCNLPTVSADGLTYTFTLAHPETTSLTAADLVRSLGRLREPGRPNGWIVRDILSMRALDARTVEIRLKRRIPYFAWLMALGSTAVVGPNGEGSGPYELTRWRKNHEMVFERRKKEKTAFNTIRYLVVDDLSTQWLMFLKGEIDYIGERTLDNWDTIVDEKGELRPELAAKGIRLYSIPSLEVLYNGINMRDPVLGPNRKLRQALNAAFDFPTWQKFLEYRVSECTTVVPPGIPDRLERPFPYRFNLEKARRLLCEAGYPNGIDPKTGRRLVLHLAVGRVDQLSRSSSELLASFYEKIGIKLVIDYMPWESFLTAVNEGRVQLYRMIWVADYPSAQNFLQLFYGPNRAPGVNHSSYENSVYDAAYEAGDYLKCQEILQEDCPWVFAHYQREYSLVGPRVGNFIQSDFPYGNEQYYENAIP